MRQADVFSKGHHVLRGPFPPRPVVPSEHNLITEHRRTSDISGCLAPSRWHNTQQSCTCVHRCPGKPEEKSGAGLPLIAGVQAPWEQHSPRAQKLLLSELLLLGMRNWPRWFENLPGNNITILSSEALPPPILESLRRNLPSELLVPYLWYKCELSTCAQHTVG